MNLSLCCISNILAEEGHKFRTMTYKSFSSKERSESLEKLSWIIINNFTVSEKIVRHCAANGIKGYRLSSDLCPVIKHPSVMMGLEDLPNYNLIKESIKGLSLAIKETGIRVSAHPGEFISLTNIKDPEVVNRSIIDLEFHGEIFDILGLERSYYNPLNIHVRQEGEPIKLRDIVMKNIERLSDGVKNRLVLENNDTGNTWTVANLKKYFFEPFGIPVTFDNLHHNMLNHGVSHRDAFYDAYYTWNCTPIFHYSEGKDGTRAHKDMAEDLPENYNEDVLFDVELKNKDYAILDLYKRYNERKILATV